MVQLTRRVVEDRVVSAADIVYILVGRPLGCTVECGQCVYSRGPTVDIVDMTIQAVR
jgi:hypothetical protein